MRVGIRANALLGGSSGITPFVDTMLFNSDGDTLILCVFWMCVIKKNEFKIC